MEPRKELIGSMIGGCLWVRSDLQRRAFIKGQIMKNQRMEASLKWYDLPDYSGIFKHFDCFVYSIRNALRGTFFGLSGIFLENKSRGGKSKLSKIEGAELMNLKIIILSLSH